MSLTIDQLVASSFEALPDPKFILDGHLRVLHGNRAWRNLMELADQTDLGGSFDPVNFGAPADDMAQMIAVVRATLSDGMSHTHTYECQIDPTKLFMTMMVSRVMIGGQPHAIVALRDETALHEAKRTADEREIQNALWAAAVQSAPDAVLTYDLDGKVTTWNRSAEQLYDYTAEEMLGQSLERLYPEDWPTSIQSYRDRILSGELTDFEAVRIAKSGTSRTVSIAAAPVTNAKGQVIGISNIHRDVTQQRKDEEARAIMAREAVHRSKNLMAVVIAIQRQIARSSETVAELSDKFSQRVASLSQSTDLLIHENYAKIPITRLIDAQLGLFDQISQSAIHVSGPGILLDPKGAQTLGMALFELLTNANKYGALSVSEGRVDLKWILDGDPGERTLCLSWTESGYAITSPPARKGFGSTVLERLASATMGGQAVLEFRETGLYWSMTFGEAFFDVAGPAIDTPPSAA